MKYNGVYTIIATTFPYGPLLIVVKEQEREAKSLNLSSCYFRKRLTRCFLERNWDRKGLWTNLGIFETEKFIKYLEEVAKLVWRYEI